MRQSIAILTLSGAAALAQTSLTKIWLPDPTNPGPYTESPDHYPSWAASIIHADPTATTYALSDPDVTNPPGQYGIDGDPNDYFALTQGPSTLAYTEDDNSDGTSMHAVVTCTVDGKHVLQCMLSSTLIDGTSTDIDSTSFSDPGYLGHTMPLTITAGLEKLGGGSSSSTAAPSGPTSSATGAHSTLTAVPNTGTGSAPAPTGTGAGNDSPNAAVSQIKGQNALLAGLVAVVGAVLML